MENSFCLLNPDTQMGVSSGCLVLKRGGECIDTWPLSSVERILVYGNSQITTQAIKTCLQQGIEVAYFTTAGRFLGSLHPLQSKATERKELQFSLLANHDACLSWGRALIYAKLKSQELEYRRMADNGWHARKVEFLRFLREKEEQVLSADHLQRLLGLEGISARRYYSYFGDALPRGWDWKGREYHPCRDNVNALLSLTYSIVTTYLENQCWKHGLDPNLSFFHRRGYGSGGLATDLIEPIRSSICDHSVLRLLHAKQISPSHFVKHKEGIQLTEEGFRKFMKFHLTKTIPVLEDFCQKLFPLFIHSLKSPQEKNPDFSCLQPLK